jgi:hypothetical protein
LIASFPFPSWKKLDKATKYSLFDALGMFFYGGSSVPESYFDGYCPRSSSKDYSARSRFSDASLLEA